MWFKLISHDELWPSVNACASCTWICVKIFSLRNTCFFLPTHHHFLTCQKEKKIQKNLKSLKIMRKNSIPGKASISEGLFWIRYLKSVLSKKRVEGQPKPWLVRVCEFTTCKCNVEDNKFSPMRPRCLFFVYLFFEKYVSQLLDTTWTEKTNVASFSARGNFTDNLRLTWVTFLSR